MDLEDIVDGGFLRKQEKSLDEQMAIDVQSRDFTYEDDEEEGVDLKGGSLHNNALTDLLLLPYKPVEKMELERFLGRWYEIARIPNRWQASGDYTTVSYLKNPHTGRLRILSKTYIDGRRHEQSGRLWVMDSTKNSTYKVQFRWPFTGVFWVLHIGEKEDYGKSILFSNWFRQHYNPTIIFLPSIAFQSLRRVCSHRGSNQVQSVDLESNSIHGGLSVRKTPRATGMARIQH